MLNETKLDKKNCIIIGDSYDSDIKGGEGIGIKSILVRTENKNDYKWYCKGLENIIGKIKNVMK
ncbi:MAG: HAD hydrolase-like protein [Treponema sp.]|nr:HAD hydrolase-like protein [Treponema sp.]